MPGLLRAINMPDSNADNITQPGCYAYGTGNTGAPGTGQRYGILVVMRRDQQWFQFFYSYGTGFEAWGRVKTTTNNWEDWVRMDNFGCNTPEALALLLGALIYSTNIKENSTITDLNAETGNSNRFSRFFVSQQSAPDNLPNGVSSNRFFLEIYNMSNYYILQKIYIAQTANISIYYRSKFGDNNWTNWKTIA